ncbi:MAG TPA: flavodoxin domain-containing protein [bacterium]|nr:flavodoxin domain-containing protein [bacterium]
MKGPESAVRVTDHVYWVGAIDWGIRNFHGYLTSRGTTYNAYLVLADRITLIDTVKAPFVDEMLARIASVVELDKIDYIISNHSEMDHTGALPGTIEAVKPERVFASVMGAKAISSHFELGREVVPVKNGESLSLGNMSLTFVHTPMLHWPDSMLSYLAEDEVLFCQDAFGMHLASTERFDDEIGKDVLVDEAAKYYANILLPFSPLVTKLIESLPTLGLMLKTVAPDHGPIWRAGFENVLRLYSEWAAQRPSMKAVVLFDTMWHSTEMMANALCEGLKEGGASVHVMPLGSCHRSEVATAVMQAGALLVGSPTMNNNIFPSVADVLTYLKGLKPKNLLGAAFGSFGWSGEAVGHINDFLRAMKVELVSEGVKSNYVPNRESLDECYSLGTDLARKMKERC